MIKNKVGISLKAMLLSSSGDQRMQSEEMEALVHHHQT